MSVAAGANIDDLVELEASRAPVRVSVSLHHRPPDIGRCVVSLRSYPPDGCREMCCQM